MINTRCSRCILPSTYSGIQFDAEGVCNVCKSWDLRWKDRRFKGQEAEFRRIFVEKSGQYDCILPFSGGKDSSYVLYYLIRKLGLKPLAVNLNNHFQTEIIKENIELVIKKLGVDMLVFSPDFTVWSELMRRCFERSLIPCLPCDVGIYALAYRTALMTNTRVIVFPGGKLAAPKTPGRGIIMYKSLEQVARQFDDDRGLVDLSNFEITQNMIDTVKEVYFGEYFDWQENEILHTVVEKMGWKKKGEQHSRIDCIFEPIINYLYSVRMGVSKQCTRLSSMVRDGQISREKALNRDSNYMLTEVPSEFKTVMELIGVGPEHIRHQIEKHDLLKPLWYQ